MKHYSLQNFTKGWVIGDFSPSVLKTDLFEVAIHEHGAGCETFPHFHKETTELTVVISGSVRVNGITLGEGQMWIYDPFDVSDVQFLEDTKLVVVRWPSKPGDKFLIEGDN